MWRRSSCLAFTLGPQGGAARPPRAVPRSSHGRRRPPPPPPHSGPSGRPPFAEARLPSSECALQNYAIIFKKPSVCAHIFIFSQKKEKPELLFFCSVPLAKSREPIVWARDLPANPASGKAGRPGAARADTPEEGSRRDCDRPFGEPFGRSTCAQPRAKASLPAKPSPPAKPLPPDGQPPSIGRATYADAPFAACPSLRAEATACAAPSAHCSAACRS